MNPMELMKLKGYLDVFKRNHPKVPMFFRDAAGSIGEGAVIEITVTSPEGRRLCTNMRVTAEDMELVQNLRNINVQ